MATDNIVANIVGLYLCYRIDKAMGRWFLNKICCPGYVFKDISTSKHIILLDKEVYYLPGRSLERDPFMYKDVYLANIQTIYGMDGAQRVGLIDKSELLKIVGREKNEEYREKLKNLLKYLLKNDGKIGKFRGFLLKFMKKYRKK